MATTYGYNVGYTPYNQQTGSFYDWGGNTNVQGASSQAESLGYGGAAGVLRSMADQTYQLPTDYTSSLQGPATMGTAQYQAAQGYQNAATPTYQGLMGGDYDALRAAYRAPVTEAYNQGVNNLNSIAAAGGVYGGTGQGTHTGNLSMLNSQYQQNLMGADAAAIQMQANDLAQMNQFNASLYPENIKQQLLNYSSGLDEANRLMDYNQAALDRQYANQQAQGAFQNDTLREQYNIADTDLQRQTGLEDRMLTNWLSLSGLAQPGASSALNYQAALANTQAQQEAAQQQANAAQMAGYASAGGSVLGGLLGSDSFWNWLS